ncbi:DUF6455 family protein [Arenibacterium sp. CAU 1754]
MEPLGELMKHVRLVSGMAKVTEADLVAAYESGALSQEDWAALVQTCRTCGWANRCEDWLQQTYPVEEAPKPCLNRARLSALKKLKETL